MNYETRMIDQPGSQDVRFDHVTADARPKRRRQVLTIAGVIIALLAIAAWILSSGEEKPAFAPREGAIPAVSVVSPGRGTVEGTVNATGTLAARREIPVGVVGEGGRVIAVNVDAGDWVRAGQVLAVIDRSVQTQQAQSSAAQIEVARADANLTQANLDRALKLVDRGFISRADVDRLTAIRDAARARVRVAEAQYRELLARNARLNILAPAGGLVLVRNVEPGQVLGAGAQPPFTIAKGGEMEMLAQIGEADLASIPVGATGEVLPVGTEKPIVGTVWQKSPVIDAQTRQGTARLAMPYDPALRPGGFASVKINSGTVVAPMLPESAILSDDKGSYVFIVGPANKVVRRPIEIGLVTDQGITIASGLNGNEQVVVRAGGFLRAGDEIKPVAVRPAG